MIEFPGFHIKETIHESPRSRILRGTRLADTKKVIIKILNQTYPDPGARNRFRNEFEILEDKTLPNVIKPLSWLKHQGNYGIVFEDIGGTALKQFIPEQGMDLACCLQIALAICKGLDALHQMRIIHRDINPSNVVWNPETGQLRIIDFGIALVAPSIGGKIQVQASSFQGTAAYMAPEQTGRMNQPMDFRSDIYALGVTLFQLLTGKLPFPAGDLIALTHCHMAKKPPPPHIVNPELPNVLSQIILKTLEKAANQRYQSAEALAKDLTRCRQHLMELGTIPSFPLGSGDVWNTFALPQKLYGRDREKAQLMRAFHHVGLGSAEVVWVGGRSGSGKTSLVNEIHKPVVARTGYFIMGKCEQFSRDQPHQVFFNAMQMLVRQVLAEKEEVIDHWKHKIAVRLGNNAQVLKNMVPEMELLTGKLEPVPALPPMETRNRFNRVLLDFFRLFADKAHPLVLFLDDLQWADMETLVLIESALTDAGMSHFLFIGAFRNNEVDGRHPLRITMEHLKEAACPQTHIAIGSLTESDVCAYVGDTLHHPQAEVLELARVCTVKTFGNPFFLGQFLKTLCEEGLIRYNNETERWTWIIEEIQAKSITDNVAGFLVDQIETLPPATKDMLVKASALGTHFQLQFLADMLDLDAKDVATALWPAFEHNFLSANGNETLFLKNKGHVPLSITFHHDRIQQAAHDCLPAEEGRRWHLNIGKRLLAQSTEEEIDDRIFDIVGHLERGLDLIDGAQEKRRIALLHLKAGRRAKSVSAYAKALSLLLSGIRLLEPHGWEQTHELMRSFHEEAAEAAYLDTNFEEMDRILNEAVRQVKTPIESIKLIEIRVLSLFAQRKYGEAITTTLNFLKPLNVRFPKKPGKLHVLWHLMRLKWLLWGQEPEALVRANSMSDPTRLAIFNLLHHISLATYLSRPDLFPLLLFRQVEWTVRYGNAPYSPAWYVAYGSVLCQHLGDFEGGYRFGINGLELLEQKAARATVGRTLLAFNSMIRAHKEHLRTTLPALQDTYRYALQGGDLESAGLALFLFSAHAFFAGMDLDKLRSQLAKYRQAIRRLKHEPAFHLQSAYEQAAANLAGGTNAPWELQGDYFDKASLLDHYREKGETTAIFVTHLLEVKLCYLFGQYERGRDKLETAEALSQGVTSVIALAILAFYGALTRIALIPTAGERDAKHLARMARRGYKKLRKWAQHAPENFAHKADLIEAELAGVANKPEKARRYFERAIDGAGNGEFISEEALALERAAHFFFARGHRHLARRLNRDAHHTYTLWGAKNKVRALEHQFPELQQKTQSGDWSRMFMASTVTAELGMLDAMDISSVTRAYRTLASEIHLTALMGQLMRIVIENAGAERGFFLQLHHEVWTVLAESAIDGSNIHIHEQTKGGSLPAAAPMLPMGPILYAARTKEPLVLNDAAHEGAFTQDAYILEQHTKSILCLPLLNCAQLIGLIYLENNLQPGTFTEERLQILKMLSFQMAVSIENARMYGNLEGLVQKRTASLTQTLSSLKAAERHLVESEKMSALGNLVAGIAHDLATPISNGRAASAQLEEKFDQLETSYRNGQLTQEDFEKQLHFFQQASDTVAVNLERARQMITGFKELAANAEEDPPVPIYLQQKLERILTGLSPAVKKSGHHIQLNCPENLRVRCSEAALAQIVSNLVLNAFNHAFPTGTQGKVRIQAKEEEGNVLLEISDNGQGMPKHVAAQAFDAFFTTKRGKGGSGLGLHIVANLVRQKMGGFINLHTQEGRGTRFQICFPLEGKEIGPANN